MRALCICGGQEKDKNTDNVFSVTNAASTFCSSSLMIFFFQVSFMVFGEDGCVRFRILLSFRKGTQAVCMEDGLIIREQ